MSSDRNRPGTTERCASKLAAAVLEGRIAEAAALARDLQRRQAEDMARRKAGRG